MAQIYRVGSNLLVGLALSACIAPGYAAPSSTLELSRAMEKVTACIEKQKNCRFHIVGIVSPTPSCLFAVTPKAWATFSKAEQEAVVELGKLYLDWIRQSPVEATASVKSGAGISKDAPIFNTAMQQLSKVTQCKVVLASGRDRYGRPGWNGTILDNPVIAKQLPKAPRRMP